MIASPADPTCSVSVIQLESLEILEEAPAYNDAMPESLNVRPGGNFQMWHYATFEGCAVTGILALSKGWMLPDYIQAKVGRRNSEGAISVVGPWSVRYSPLVPFQLIGAMNSPGVPPPPRESTAQRKPA